MAEVMVTAGCGKCEGELFMLTCHNAHGTGHEWTLAAICVGCRSVRWVEDGCLDCRKAVSLESEPAHDTIETSAAAAAESFQDSTRRAEDAQPHPGLGSWADRSGHTSEGREGSGSPASDVAAGIDAAFADRIAAAEDLAGQLADGLEAITLTECAAMNWKEVAETQRRIALSALKRWEAYVANIGHASENECKRREELERGLGSVRAFLLDPDLPDSDSLERVREELADLDPYPPHDAHCLCGEEGHPHDCACEKCQTYKYHDAQPVSTRTHGRNSR